MNISTEIIVVYLCATLSGVLFGYNTAIINGGVLQMSEHFGFPLESWISGLIVSSGVFASFLGSILAGYLSYSYGRRQCIYFSSMCFVLSSTIAFAAWNILILFISRVLVGLSIGTVSVVVPIYLAEISRASTRGRMVTVNSIALTGGQVVASIVAYAFILTATNVGWRFMFGLGALPAVLQLWLLSKLPETPHWLRQNKRYAEADAITRQFRLEQTKACDENSDSKMNFAVFFSMLSDSDMRRRLLAACGLHFFQQFGGINTLMYYSAMVLRDLGSVSSSDAVALSIPLALTNAVFTFVCLFTIDKYGRRATCLVSLAGCFMSISATVVLAFASQIVLTEKVRAIVFFCLLTIYLMFFAPGMGPIPWLVSSEIFPMKYRSTGVAIGAMTNWLSNAIVSQIFPMLIGSMGMGWAFLFIDGFLFAALVFVFFLIPETKGKTLEEISQTKLVNL